MIISEFNLAYERKKLLYVSSIGYLILCFFVPQFFVFLPLLLYDAVWFHEIPLCIAVIFVSGNHITELLSAKGILFYLVLHVISVTFALRTQRLKRTKLELYRLQDTTKESKLVLEARNQQLIKQQDNEIYLATLKERNRIAREIHDNVGHMLSRSILMVGAAIAMNKNEESKEMLGSLKGTLSEAMNSIRSSVHDLHDGSIDLKSSIEQLVQDFTYCKVELEYDMGKEVDRTVKYCFLAILKEAFSNIIKHSHASKVEVVLREHPGMYQLLVKDNGTGGGVSSTEGIGLSNMQERVSALGGNISITSDKGYRIFVMIPRKQNNP